MKERSVPVRMDEENFKSITEADDGDEGHDASLEPAEAGEIEREDGKDEHGRNQRCRKERPFGSEAMGVKRRTKEQVETDGGAQEFGEICCDSGDFGGKPETDR